MSAQPYDPLTYENLMRGLTMHFEDRKKYSLQDDLDGIEGSGIYALYYRGSISVYRPIGSGQKPIYVGKAIPPGSRKGDTPDPTKPQIQRRLKEHKKSIASSTNLDLSDFSYRSLSVVHVWITLAEQFLIDNYKPAWNRCLEGFGDHDPGSGRIGGEKSWWDTFHPGRTWADKLRVVKGRSEAEAKLREFFRSQYP